MLKKFIVSFALPGPVLSTQLSHPGAINIFAFFVADEAFSRVGYAVNAAFDLAAGIKLVKYRKSCELRLGKNFGDLRRKPL